MDLHLFHLAVEDSYTATVPPDSNLLADEFGRHFAKGACHFNVTRKSFTSRYRAAGNRSPLHNRPGSPARSCEAARGPRARARFGQRNIIPKLTSYVSCVNIYAECVVHPSSMLFSRSYASRSSLPPCYSRKNGG